MESFREAVRRQAKRIFRIDLEESRQIDEREEHIAEFRRYLVLPRCHTGCVIRTGVRTRDSYCHTKFANFFFDFGQDLIESGRIVSPVEADARRPGLDLVGSEKGWQRLRDIVEDRR